MQPKIQSEDQSGTFQGLSCGGDRWVAVEKRHFLNNTKI